MFERVFRALARFCLSLSVFSAVAARSLAAFSDWILTCSGDEGGLGKSSAISCLTIIGADTSA